MHRAPSASSSRSASSTASTPKPAPVSSTSAAGSGTGPDEEDDLFAGIFGRRGARTKHRGSDAGYTFSVEFIEAVNGAKKRVVMADGKTLDITIPVGLKDGQTLRLRGQGQPGFGGGEPGDALVEIHVKPHPLLRREGNNIRSTLPVTPGEALAGAKVRVETVSGAVELAGPKGSNTGRSAAARQGGAVGRSQRGSFGGTAGCSPRPSR